MGFTDTVSPQYENPGLLSRLAAQATGVVRRVGKASIEAILPSGGPAGQATTVAIKATGEGAKAIGTAAANAVESAGAGVRKGFTLGVFVLILVAGLYLIGLFRRATGE